MRLGFDRLWLFLALALPALVSLIVPLPAVDLAWQVRAGELILTTGQIPTTDTFTFTAAGATWVDQQWLAQVLLALVHRSGGWELLAVVRAVVVAATFGFVALGALARGASARVASILALLAFVLAAPALALRPQLFGILIFAVLLWLVADRRRHPRRLWLAPLLVIAWANMHGSVVLVPLLLGYAWLEDVVEGRAARASFAVLVLGTLAMLVNPVGPGIWTYAVGVGTNPQITSQVSEWQHTTPFTVPGLLFYLSALGVAGLVVRRRDRLSWPAMLWLAALFAIGVWTVRGLAWWPLGAAVTIAALIPDPQPEARASRANALNVAVVGLLSLVLVLALPWWRPADPLTGRGGLLGYAPSGLATALRAQVASGDRVYVPQTWGSWFEWAVPDAGYFVDSRIELFPADVWQAYGEIAAGGDEAMEALRTRGVAFVIVEQGSPLQDQLSLDRGWAPVYEDAAGAIFRSAPQLPALEIAPAKRPAP